MSRVLIVDACCVVCMRVTGSNRVPKDSEEYFHDNLRVAVASGNCGVSVCPGRENSGSKVRYYSSEFGRQRGIQPGGVSVDYIVEDEVNLLGKLKGERIINKASNE